VVAPRRFNTPYWRSKPVAMPVDHRRRHHGEGQDAGRRKSMGSSVPVGKTSTTLKNRSRRTGILDGEQHRLARRAVSVSSTRVWAA
jgi:hypothetical protein